MNYTVEMMAYETSAGDSLTEQYSSIQVVTSEDGKFHS